MAAVIFGMRVSLDGYVEDRHGSSAPLYPDLETIAENPTVKDAIEKTGSVVLGRRTYDMFGGDVTGYEFQVPIFVLTHEAPAEPPKGENENLRLAFVTDGIEKAVGLAKDAAGDRIVQLIGASAGQQALAAGLVDELSVAVVPVLFGDGTPMFGDLDDPPELERLGVVESEVDTELRFRVVR
jgi:dihydrofolate reductase